MDHYGIKGLTAATLGVLAIGLGGTAPAHAGTKFLSQNVQNEFSFMGGSSYDFPTTHRFSLLSSLRSGIGLTFDVNAGAASQKTTKQLSFVGFAPTVAASPRTMDLVTATGNLTDGRTINSVSGASAVASTDRPIEVASGASTMPFGMNIDAVNGPSGAFQVAKTFDTSLAVPASASLNLLAGPSDSLQGQTLDVSTGGSPNLSFSLNDSSSDPNWNPDLLKGIILFGGLALGLSQIDNSSSSSNVVPEQSSFVSFGIFLAGGLALSLRGRKRSASISF